MIVSVFGLGAVGLPLSLILSIKEVKVYGVDISEKRLYDIKNGKSGLYEFYENKNIDEILLEEINKGNFIPTKDYEEAIKNSNVLIITIPLPLRKDKTINYDFLIKGVENIGKYLKKEDLIILRSTVPIGTTRKIVLPILEGVSGLKAEKDFYLSYVPERMAEGKAFDELINMTTVIGGIGEKSTQKTLEFLKKYFNGDYHIVNEVEVAEASKIVENLQRDLNIAMVNTLSLFLIKNNLVPSEVIDSAKTHKRVKNLLSPGLGVGGHCLPYAYYYLKESKKFDKILEIFKLGREINDNMPKMVLKLILDKLKRNGKNPKESKISILGLAMKDFSKDTRESPSIKFIKYAKNYFKEVLAYDPEVNIDLEEKRDSLKEVLKNSDVLVIPILQNSYKDLTVQDIKNLMNKKALIVDIKKLFKENDLKSFGFEYIIF